MALGSDSIHSSFYMYRTCVITKYSFLNIKSESKGTYKMTMTFKKIFLSIISGGSGYFYLICSLKLSYHGYRILFISQSEGDGGLNPHHANVIESLIRGGDSGISASFLHSKPYSLVAF